MTTRIEGEVAFLPFISPSYFPPFSFLLSFTQPLLILYSPLPKVGVNEAHTLH